MPLSSPILKTKFFLPQPTSDFVYRNGLDIKFEKLVDIPVMMVSAATGYGKSTLISSFLLKQEDLYSWLSLNEKDNETHQFILYFITAIQRKIEGFGEDVLELIGGRETPDIEILAELTINYLADLDKHFYLVLDDYHLIRNADIHKFISKLFEFPQPRFRLIVITRRDPELPLPKWRNTNNLIEIRSSDLKFDQREILEFFNKAVSYRLDEQTLLRLEELTDGWISGLRLLSLSIKDQEELIQSLDEFKYRNTHVIYQLILTILQNRSASSRDQLLKLSILSEFNLDLFSELCLSEDEKEQKAPLFEQFISEIVSSNLFIIALDDKHNWYRFHHLFTEQLHEALRGEYNDHEINNLHLKAASWYFRNNFMEEAIRYYMMANKTSQAIEVFTEYKLRLICETRFPKLEELYNLFPEDLVDGNRVLLLTRAWVYLFKGNIPQLAETLDIIEQKLEKDMLSTEANKLFYGEFYALRTYDLYMLNIDIEACSRTSQKAISLLGEMNPYASGVAWVFYSASVQMLKSTNEAKQLLYAELELQSNNTLNTQIYLVLCYLDWFEGDFKGVVSTAQKLIKLGVESKQKMAVAQGNFFVGLALFNQCDYKQAQIHLEQAFQLRYFAILSISFSITAHLAVIEAEKGNREGMERYLQICETLSYERGGRSFITIVKSFAADLDLGTHNEKMSIQWASENDYTNYLPIASLHIPEITQARILVNDKARSSWVLSLKILDQMLPVLESRKNINFQVRAYLAMALVKTKLKDVEEGRKYLQKALKLSAPRQFYRPYMEMGTSIKDLLLECVNMKKYSDHIQEITALLSLKTEAGARYRISNREKEILLMAEKLTNKEVGNKLFISEKTVKRHITNINKKLEVNTKWEALEKARKMKLL